MSEIEIKKMGRPQKEFDKKIVEGLCSVLCTYEEIEHILSTDKRVIDRWCQREYGQTFDELYKKYSESAKASLRRNQLKLSATHPVMAIWLGKQLLGQRDRQPEEATQINFNVFCNEVPK